MMKIEPRRGAKTPNVIAGFCPGGQKLSSWAGGRRAVPVRHLFVYMRRAPVVHQTLRCDTNLG